MSTSSIRFLDALRCRATRVNYESAIRVVVGDAGRFLELARSNRRAAEDCLVDWISKKRGSVSGATIRGAIAAVKSFLDFYEISLNWKRIGMSMPPGRKVACDRSPTTEEVRQLLLACDSRMRAVVLVLCSSGMRIGGLEDLNIGDYIKLKSGLGRLRVYQGEVEEYWAFISPEAVSALDDYLGERGRVSEELTSKSPLFRDKWDFSNSRGKIDPAIVSRVTSKALRTRLGFLWVKAGVRMHNHDRGDFQQAHGFRKWFKTQADRSKVRRDDVEVLMGHLLNYHKPTLDYLEEQYMKAIPCLTISESEELRRENTEIQRRFETVIKSLEERLNRIELERLKEKVEAKAS